MWLEADYCLDVTAVWCSAVQYVAVSGSVLQRVAVRQCHLWSRRISICDCSVLQCVADVLQCGAVVCDSVVQCVAACCSMLQSDDVT